jgi:predicted DsbA family dithiol-disulfide isomerase
VRLHTVLPGYRGRVRLRTRCFPLEVNGGEPPPRDILEQEWWLAALQEPAAIFVPYREDDWPATTLPTFRAAWSAFQLDEVAGCDFDLRVRHAFFGESRNIGRREVLLAIAREAGLDLPRFTQLLDSERSRTAVLQEGQLGREQYGVRGTPTLMLPDGTRLRHPIAIPLMHQRRVVGVRPLPCRGDGCLEATRDLFEEALRHGTPAAGSRT